MVGAFNQPSTQPEAFQKPESLRLWFGQVIEESPKMRPDPCYSGPILSRDAGSSQPASVLLHSARSDLWQQQLT